MADSFENPHVQRSQSNFQESRQQKRKFDWNFESSTACVRVLLTASLLCLVAPAPVRADTSATEPSAPVMVVPGSVRAFRSAELGARTRGTVKSVNVDILDHVKNGQVLCRIDAPELNARSNAAAASLDASRQGLAAADAGIKQAEAKLEAVNRQLEACQADLKVQQAALKMEEDRTAGRSEPARLDLARALVDTAQANLAVGQANVGLGRACIESAKAERESAAAQAVVAQAQLDEAHTLLDSATIVAPFDGVIAQRSADPGDRVAADGKALFGIVQINVVTVFVAVPKAEASGITAGTDAEIKLDGQSFSAKVARVSSAADPPHRRYSSGNRPAQSKRSSPCR
jgi:HlyD family secretion protein